MTRPLRDTARDALIYGIGNAGMSLLSLALIPIYTREMTTAEYGLLALVMLYHAVMTRFYDLGLTNAVGRFYFEPELRSRGALGGMLATIQGFLFLWGAALSVLGWFAAPAVSGWIGADAGSAHLFRLVTMVLLVEALMLPTLTLMRMQERAGMWVTIQFGRLALSLVLNIWLVAVQRLGVEGVLIAYLVSASVAALACAADTVPRLVLRFDVPLLRKMLVFALPFLPVLLGVLVIDLSDRLLLTLFRGEAEVGIYTLGYKFGQVVLLGVTAFTMAWTPIRYRIYEASNARELYARVGTLYTAGAALAVVGVSVFGDEVVRLTSTPAYWAGARVIPLVAGAYALYGLHVVATVGMGVTRRTAALPVIIFAATAINLVANVALIPEYGMIAAAATTTLAYVVMVVGTFWASHHVYPVDYDWRRLVAIVGAAVAAILVDSILSPDNWLAEAGVGAATLIAFIVAMFAIGAFSLDDVHRARSWVADALGQSRASTRA